MDQSKNTPLTQLRGAVRLIVDTADSITGIVERVHRTVQLKPAALGKPATGRPGGITGLVYRNVRGGIALVGQAIDATLGSLDGLLPQSAPTPARRAMRAALNGVCGDHLVRTDNPLAITMSLRDRGTRIDPDTAASALQLDEDAITRGKVLILVHGLCMNDQHWEREGHDHGAALADELGYTPLYLHYNTGLRIAHNGRALADALEALIGNWPAPLTELAILGHSMGGLVARSACHYADQAGHAWRRHLRKLVFLGTPHHGAPLEKGGQGLDYVLQLSPYSEPFTRIGRTRSAGIMDLRYGVITTGPHKPMPLPSDVRCYAVAAVRSRKGGAITDRLVGDGLVPLDSALGRHRDSAHTLAIPKERQSVVYQTGHFDLLNDSAVYATIRSWLRNATQSG